ncbi:MAG: 50S ribosomal protein L15 [Alphaproteobacteria bacterium]|nr:50S ribosomal protein L15 [Alphaproteobacteria bacterium]
MKLNEIRDNPGAHKRFKRLGRGTGSGKGKTSGKGVKGQKARTGHHGMFGFEGGQMPLHMRIPKRGFNNIFAREFAIVNTGQLQKAVENGKLKAGDTVNAETLATQGIARRAKDGVRLLGKGALKTQLNLEVAHASGSAIEAVKKAGGHVKVVGVKAKHVTRKDRGPGKRVQRRIDSAKKREERAAAALQAKQA